MQPRGRINPLLLAGLAIVTAVGLGASFWLLHHALRSCRGDCRTVDPA